MEREDVRMECGMWSGEVKMRRDEMSEGMGEEGRGDERR